MNGEERPEGQGEDLFGFSSGHRRSKPAECDTEKLLDNLKADDSLAGFQRMIDKTGCNDPFCGSGTAQFIDKDIGVEEESIVHSFRRAHKGRWH